MEHVEKYDVICMKRAKNYKCKIYVLQHDLCTMKNYRRTDIVCRYGTEHPGTYFDHQRDIYLYHGTCPWFLDRQEILSSVPGYKFCCILTTKRIPKIVPGYEFLQW